MQCGFEFNYVQIINVLRTRLSHPHEAQRGLQPTFNLVRYHVTLTWRSAMGGGLRSDNDTSVGSGEDNPKADKLVFSLDGPWCRSCRRCRNMGASAEDGWRIIWRELRSQFAPNTLIGLSLSFTISLTNVYCCCVNASVSLDGWNCDAFRPCTESFCVSAVAGEHAVVGGGGCVELAGTKLYRAARTPIQPSAAARKTTRRQKSERALCSPKVDNRNINTRSFDPSKRLSYVSLHCRFIVFSCPCPTTETVLFVVFREPRVVAA